jgi:CubicO group peptidase (beta-lactamase class C family)
MQSAADRPGLSRRQVIKLGAGTAGAVLVGAGAAGAVTFAGASPLIPVGSLPRMPRFVALWTQTSVTRPTYTNLTRASLVARIASLLGAEHRVRSLTSHVGTDGTLRYSVVFEAWSGTDQRVELGLDSGTIQTRTNELNQDGLRLSVVNVCFANGSPTYDAVYVPGTWGQALTVGRQFADLVSWKASEAVAGRTVEDITSYVDSGTPMFTAFSRGGTTEQRLKGKLTRAEFTAAVAADASTGFRVKSVSTHVDPAGTVRYNYVSQFLTSARELTLNEDVSSFERTRVSQLARGYQVAQLVVEKVEDLSLDAVLAAMKTSLDGTCAGWAVTASAAGRVRSIVGGERRTAADPPAQAASAAARHNIATATRAFTAVAAIKLLATKSRTLDEPIAAYLPSDWAKGPGVSGITFRGLLTLTSGLRSQAESYLGMRAAIATGIKAANVGVRSESHMSFALLRVLLPYLGGFTDSGVASKDIATSDWFLDYLNVSIFAVLNMPTVVARPVDLDASMSYPFPVGTAHGATFGDWTTLAGSRGLHLSVAELADFGTALWRTTPLVTAAQRKEIRDLALGWSPTDHSVTHGTLQQTGGEMSDGLRFLTTSLCSFSTGLQIAVVVYSATTDGMAPSMKAREANAKGWVTFVAPVSPVPVAPR